MRYIGSKNSLLNDIYGIVEPVMDKGSFCDPFGGIGVVGSFFKGKGFEVTSSDILTFPYYFQIAKIQNNSISSFSNLFNSLAINSIDELLCILNNTQYDSGWFYENYAIKRQFFTIENAKKIEGCRRLIFDWSCNGLITKEEKAVLLASLINSMDKVANTAGTYYAYLKGWYRKALQPFKFEIISPSIGNLNCKSYNLNAFELVNGMEYDVLYLDPPYNQRSYSRYYHLPESIANLEENEVHGKSGSPILPSIISDFNSSKRAFSALEEIVLNTKFKLLLFHYTDEGLISNKELYHLFSNLGKVEVIEMSCTNWYSVKKGKSSFVQKIYKVVNG
ncbi:MAG: DNA adenine methylase [Prolixibacteraceae bacterium]|nr:DNA adenine methylase [Prolixibacteraceae bacterium]